MEYTIHKKSFQGHEQIFRQWTDGKIEIKLTDEFAKANGYLSLNDMLDSEPEMKRQLLRCNLGTIPEWAMVSDKGDFLVMDKSKMN